MIYGMVQVAPIYSRWYGRTMAERFIEKLGVEYILKEQQIYIIGEYDDVALPRHVVTVYEIREPVYRAEQKIRNHLSQFNRWHVDKDNSSAYCNNLLSSEVSSNLALFLPSWKWNEINLDQSGYLTVTLQYRSNVKCLLKQE
jgi:hypothetical protein